MLWCAIRYSGPVRIRMIFQSCGGVFVKFGQMLALRSDIVSVPLAFELLNLLENLPPTPTSKIRDHIERELGQSIDSIFASFEDTPLAIASFAQVHRASLHDGRNVVVKVQKPLIADIVKIDLGILHIVAILIDIFSSHRPISLRSVYKEFSVWTLRELDYELEAEAIEKFTGLMTLPFVKAPSVVREYTATGVLTESYISGISVAKRL